MHHHDMNPTPSHRLSIHPMVAHSLLVAIVSFLFPMWWCSHLSPCWKHARLHGHYSVGVGHIGQMFDKSCKSWHTLLMSQLCSEVYCTFRFITIGRPHTPHDTPRWKIFTIFFWLLTFGFVPKHYYKFGEVS